MKALLVLTSAQGKITDLVREMLMRLGNRDTGNKTEKEIPQKSKSWAVKQCSKGYIPHIMGKNGTCGYLLHEY